MNAKRDNNQIPVLLGTSNADGITPLALQVDPTTHAIITDDGTTGSDLSRDDAYRDDNLVPVMIGVSSADGLTPTNPYIHSSTGKLLIKSI